MKKDRDDEVKATNVKRRGFLKALAAAGVLVHGMFAPFPLAPLVPEVQAAFIPTPGPSLPIGFTQQAQTLFNAMTVQPSLALKIAINNLISAFIANGYWALCDEIYMLALHTAQAAMLNWKNPAQSLSYANDGGANATFNINRGFIGNGHGGLVSPTNMNALSQYVQNSAHVSAWFTQGASNFAYSVGESVNLTSGLYLDRTNTFGYYINGATQQATTSISTLNGWFVADRSGSGATAGYQNGVSNLTGTDTSEARGTTPLGILKCSNQYSNASIAFASDGADVTSIIGSTYTALLAYMTAVGVVAPTPTAPWAMDFTTSPSIINSANIPFSLSNLPAVTIRDWEGRVIFCPAGELCFDGYRRVQNLLSGTGLMSTQTVAIAAGTSAPPGNYVLSFTGTGSVVCSGAGSQTVNGQGASTRVTGGTFACTAATLTLTVSGTVQDAQLEFVGGQSNTNPSEYVSVGDTPSPYHGNGIDGVQYFTYQNGNTVSSGVVTAGTGAALTTLRGYANWQSSYNLCQQSGGFANSPWSAVGSPTLTSASLTCGQLTLDLVNDTSNSALQGYKQTITFTAASGQTDKPISIYIAQGSSSTSVVRIHDATASVDRLFAVITWSGGLPVVTCSAGSYAALFPSGQSDTMANGVFRLCMRAPGVVAANTNTVEVYPAADASLTTSLTGSLYAGAVQCEDGIQNPGTSTGSNSASCTAYIPTTNATAYRQGGGPVTTLTSWFNTSQGTIYTEVMFGTNDTTGTVNGNHQFTMQIDDGTANNRYLSYREGDNGNLPRNGTIVSGSSVDGSSLPTALAAFTPVRFALAYQAGNGGSCATGSSAIDFTSGYTLPSGLTEFYLGSNVIGGASINGTNGYIRKANYSNLRDSDSTMHSFCG